MDLTKPIAVGQISNIRKRFFYYDAYLASEEWQAKRQAVLKAWGFRCGLCEASAGVEVHHNTYKRIGREWWRDLLPLCRECHQAHHDRRGHGDDPLKGWKVGSGEGWGL